jgi:phytoene dehydrogenase-like protein
LDASSPLMIAPVLTLAAQAVMALIGYLRDYGAERLEAERARAAEALEGRRVAQAEAAALREELRRREEREDAEKEARYLKALEELEELRMAR